MCHQPRLPDGGCSKAGAFNLGQKLRDEEISCDTALAPLTSAKVTNTVPGMGQNNSALASS